jgi:hypothetical protein
MTRVKEILKADSRYKEGLAVLEKAMKIEDQEEREKAIAEFSRLLVAVAYDRAEVYELLAFTLIQSADTLLRASYDMLDTVKDNVKYNDRFKLTDAMSKLNKMIATFDTESVKFHKDYHLHGEVEDSDLTPFDAINNNSTVILHFIMLIYNALKRSKGNAKILEKSLLKLKGVGEDIFSIEEINSL